MKVETYCTAKKRKREVNEEVKMVERRMEKQKRERERAILGARPSMSFSNRMKKSRRERIVGQSLVDCTLYRK